jgi:hypothetical protein
MVRSEGNMSLKNPVTPPGIDPGTVRLVTRRFDHYANPRPPFSSVANISMCYRIVLCHFQRSASFRSPAKDVFLSTRSQHAYTCDSYLDLTFIMDHFERRFLNHNLFQSSGPVIEIQLRNKFYSRREKRFSCGTSDCWKDLERRPQHHTDTKLYSNAQRQ